MGEFKRPHAITVSISLLPAFDSFTVVRQAVNMDYVIDIQGFHHIERQFIPKEVTVLTLEGSHSAHWIVEPPHPFEDMHSIDQTRNNHVTCYHHGIEWFEGDISLRKLNSYLREIARTAHHILTRGYEKARYLERATARKIVNLENFDCPSFAKLEATPEYCLFHGVKKEEYYTCALNNAVKLKKWLTASKFIKAYDHSPRVESASDRFNHISQSTTPVDSKCRNGERSVSTVEQQEQVAAPAPPIPAKNEKRQPPTRPERKSSLRRNSVEVRPPTPGIIPKKLEYPEEAEDEEGSIVSISEALDQLELYSTTTPSPRGMTVSEDEGYGQSTNSAGSTDVAYGPVRGFRSRPSTLGLDIPNSYCLQHR